MHPAVKRRDLRGINWAEVAARARADLGDERVERASALLRLAMMAVADAARPASVWGQRNQERDSNTYSNTYRTRRRHTQLAVGTRRLRSGNPDALGCGCTIRPAPMSPIPPGLWRAPAGSSSS